MSDATTQEKRQRKRYQKDLEVDFCANGRTYRGVSHDFSISGLFIKTYVCLALESTLFIKVHLQDGSISELQGRVRRVQKVSYAAVRAPGHYFKEGMGIEIIERDSSYIKFFMSLMSSRYTRP